VPDSPSPSTSFSPPPPTLRGLLPTLIVSALLPFLTYRILSVQAPWMSEVARLLIAGTFPAAHSVVGIYRRRTLDIVAIMVVAGIAVSIVATFIGGDARLLLIRESFVTGALGIVALSSFAWKRPLLFYIGRQMSSAQDPTRKAQFDALWERPRAARVFRVLTLVWGVVWLLECALRIAMAETLAISTVLAISPIVFTAANLGVFGWMFWYIRRVRRKSTAG
jgi:hypothetical protein